MKDIEHIIANGSTLAFIVRGETNPDKTVFLTPPHFNLQLGFVVHAAGGVVTPHVHRSLERRIIGTSEVLVVKKGRCEIDIYNHQRELVATRELREGDLVLTVNGGHAFRMLEDTILLEVKQGPYGGVDDNERFLP